MAKNLNSYQVSLDFKANTSQAKQEMAALQSQLTKLMQTSTQTFSGSKFTLTKDIGDATVAVAQLKTQLEAATNVDTGRLDLSKFSDSLRKSGLTLQQYQTTLNSLGPNGQKAFAALAQSISQAEIPLRRSNALIESMWTTMKNTARWQLSSSILHGVIGTYQQAMGYARDLNESLNNIRIVTGQSVDQMARFAAEANEAARALSTTTTEYTNAALIFYQQGLSDNEVKERTDVTIKLANVAKQSAEVVSDQMTAIWNNFDDGSKSLEYYADVMTALGAATASSTDEIAGGLEKFAAVADTIGLSYEYAASALATITSNTRQSEDVVGTALKTIFARIQGLNLGETLEDGTTLNKYSEALDKVGISIFESNGQIKRMDDILDEMAEKWQNLAKDQQIALAQTVAGVRQYTQLVSLMDNWDSGDSDSMTANLATSYGATGALDEQSEIYAESWEAARDRVKASAESIYSALLNDDFFIDLNNTIADVLDTIEHLITAFGGVQGVIAAISFAIMTTFKTQLSGAIDNFIYSVRGTFGAVKKEMTELQNDATNLLMSNAKQNGGGEAGGAIAEAYRQQALFSKAYLGVRDKLTESEQKSVELLQSQVNTMAEKVRLSAEELQNKERTTRALERTLEIEMARDFKNMQSIPGATQKKIDFKETNFNNEAGTTQRMKIEVVGIEAFKTKFASLLADFKQGQKELGIFDQAIEQALDVNLDSSSARQELKAIMDSLNRCTKLTANMPKAIKGPFNDLKAALQNPATSIEDLKQKWETFNNALIENYDSLSKGSTGFQNLQNALTALKAAFPNQDFSQLDAILEDLQQELYETGGASQTLSANSGVLSSMVQHLSASLKELTTSTLTAGQTIMSLAQGISSLAMAIQAAQGLKKIWDDDTISTGEKLLQTCITLGMVIPGVINGTKSLWSGLGGIVTGIKTHVIPSFTALSASTAGTGVAAGGAAPGVLTFGASLQAAMGPIGWICLALTALVGIFALIVTAVTNANSAQETANKAFKQAAADAQEAANALDNAKSAYDDLKETISDYQDARNGLDELIAGTDEFKNKIQETNAYARELMETYGAKGSYNSDTGLWEISPEEQDNALKRYDEKLQAAQINNATAQSNLNLANINKKNANLAASGDKGYWDYYGSSVGSTIGTMTAVGATTGAVAAAAGVVTAWTAPVTAAIGGLIGALSSLIGSFATAAMNVSQQEETNKQQVAALENLQAAFIETGGDFEAAKNSLTDADLNLIAALGVTDSELEALCQEVAANTAAIRENNKQIIDDYFKDNATYKNSEHQDALSNLMAADLHNQTQNLYDTVWSSDAGQYSDEEAQKLYAEKMGYTWVSDEDNGVGKYADANGNELTIGDDQARMYLAQQEALLQVGANIDTLNSNLNILSDNVNAASQLAYSQAMGGDITGVKIGAENPGGFVQRDEAGNILLDENNQPLADPAALQEYLGIDDATFEAIWKAKGYSSAEAYTEAFNQQLQGFDADVAELDLVNQITGSGELTLGVAQKFEQMLDDMIDTNGEDAGQKFVNQFNDQIMSKLNPKDYEEALGRLTNIDWSDWNAGEKAAEIMRDYGVEIDTSSEAWKQFVQDTRNATLSAPNMDELVSNLSKIQELTSNIKVGDILSQEDYELLVKYNSALAGYFAILADGSAKLVGDPLDLQQAVAETVQNQYKEAAQAALNNADFYTKQYEAGLNALGGDADKLNDYSSSVAYQNDAGEWKYRGSDARSQIEFLESQGYGDTEEGAANLERWKNDIYGLDENGTTTTTGVLEEIGTAVAEMGPTFAESAQQAQLWSATYQGALNSIALSADDANARLELLKSGEINAEAYSYAATAAHNEEKWEGMDPSEVEDYAEAIENAAKASDLLDDNITEEVAEDVALYTKKMNQGVDKLSKGFKEWNSIIKKSDKASQEYAEAMTDMKDAMSDVLGTSEEFISDDFIVKNLEDIEKAAEGDAEAIDRLSAALGKQIIMDITVDGSAVEQQALDAHDNLQTLLDGKKVGFSVTADMDTSGIIEGAQEVINAAGMTVEQAQAYFNSLGYEPTFVMEDQEVPLEGTRTITENVVVGTQYLDGPGEGQQRAFDYIASADTRTEAVPMGTQIVSVPALSADGTPQIESLHKKGGGAMNNSSSANKGGKSGGGGGGGSKKKKADKVKKSDVVERYKEINDELEETRRLMDKNSKLADTLWGESKFKKMREGVELLKQENEQLEERLGWSRKYLAEDKDALLDATKEAGINFKFDKNTGEITNYTSEMEKLYTKLDNAITKANADGNVTEAEQEEIDKWQERIDAVEEARKDYEGTLEEMRSDEEAYLENQLKIWEENFNILNEELELKITINDSEMSILDYYLDKIADDIYSVVEGYAYMNDQADLLNSNLEAQNQYYQDLRAQYEAGEISLAQYKEGLLDAQGATIENLQALQELKESMQDYYGNVLALAQDNIASYIDSMEHLTSVLDHYSSIMDIIGKEQDYDAKGSILAGRANTLRNELDTQTKLYENYSAQAKEWKDKMDNAVVGSNEYETYKKNWEAAQEAANEAQENMLSKTEEWAEAMRACVENELNGLAQTLENSLTGGTNFDTMLTSMERASSLQEEYLTTTNQIYETNKLMRQAQQEIDKTTNSVAKRRLQGFINETQQLQDQTELSQYELEIQQAKYDLLLAEIALEEAQNAKSTVRLQRDSEGNFGYVYTADSSKIAEAQQQLEDAQNSLYNIGLEGANDYNQKYAETMSEMYDTLTELQTQYLEGAFESEQEYQDAVTAAKEYYYDKLKQYSNLYAVALTTDTRVVADAWSTDFNDMMYKTDEWKGHIDDYTAAAAESLSAWASVVSTVLAESGLDKVDEKVANVVTESDKLKASLIGEDGNGGVVAAMQQEIEEAGRLSQAMIGVQNSIDGVIESYEEFLGMLNAEYTNPTSPPVEPDPPEEDKCEKCGKPLSQCTCEDEEEPDPDPPTGPTWDRVKAAYDRINSGRWGNGIDTRIRNGKDEGFTEEEVRLGQKLINKVYGGMSLSAAKKALGFDTGGYTGDWAGSYGKLAFLHQKELVLNQGDTENFLTSMEVLERILQMIDLQSASSQIGGLLNSPSIGPASSEPLEQNVHIEASFPNVSDRNEIEEAFSNLINLASQYAYRD